MSSQKREPVQANPGARPVTADHPTDQLEEFVEVVGRSSLGTRKALANQRLGNELRLAFEARTVGQASEPPTGATLMLAVGRHLHDLELHGAAELAYSFAAERGSLPAILTLVDLLDHQGRPGDARRWYEFAVRLHGRRANLPISSVTYDGDRHGTESLVKSTPPGQLDKYVSQHSPDAQLWDVVGAILRLRDNKVHAGRQYMGDEGLTATIILQIARAIMEHVEVQCERTDAPPTSDPALGRVSGPSGNPTEIFLRWRPSKSEVNYWLRVKWRNHIAPNFVPKPIQSEILFLIANACFSAGALVDWAECGHNNHPEVGSWHSTGVIQFFEDISRRYTPPHTQEIAASFAELAEADIATRIARSVIVGVPGAKGTRRRTAEAAVIDPHKKQIISRAERLATAGESTDLGSYTLAVCGRFRSEQARSVLTDIRQRYGETVRSVLDGQVQLMCMVRGPQNTASLIDHAVRLSEGSDAKLRELFRTVLSYMHILSLLSR